MQVSTRGAWSLDLRENASMNTVTGTSIRNPSDWRRRPLQKLKKLSILVVKDLQDIWTKLCYSCKLCIYFHMVCFVSIFFIFNVQFCFLKIVIELCCRKMLFLYVYMINIVFHSMNFEWEYFCSVFLQLHVLYRCYLCFCRLNSLTWFWLGFNSFIDTSKTSLETFFKGYNDFEIFIE